MKLDTVLVDRYQIREQLSHEYSAEMKFLAQDISTQNRVFIKMLRFEDFQQNELRLFQQEAQTLQRLSHPAIPGYLDYFVVETADIRGVALVQAYIEAPSLESLVEAGRQFSAAEVIELADRLLSILTYLHEQNPPVIHRGINPSSILMTNRSDNSIGDVYLVDFGEVRRTASQLNCTFLPSYKDFYTPLHSGRAITAPDLYSLGLTIVYLLTGIHPAEFLQDNGQVKFPSEVSQNLHSWLEKMTQADQSKRFVLAHSAQTELKSLNFRTSNLIEIGKRVFENILKSVAR
jgi:serine/threonine protein kinase